MDRSRYLYVQSNLAVASGHKLRNHSPLQLMLHRQATERLVLRFRPLALDKRNIVQPEACPPLVQARRQQRRRRRLLWRRRRQEGVLAPLPAATCGHAGACRGSGL